MVFDPSSTFDTVRKNLNFLNTLCGDGTAAVSLGKMLPLAGTGIEEELRQQKRLYGSPAYEDYEFLDPLLNEYFRVLADVFRPWMHGEEGVMTLSRWIRFKVAAFQRFHFRDANMQEACRVTVSSANRFLIKSCRDLADTFQSSSESQCLRRLRPCLVVLRLGMTGSRLA
jgi:hypothetical protein